MTRANLLKLQITNFKKIKSVDVDFGGRSFLLIGKNQAGKSSFIQALKILLNISQMPPDPVTKGHENGSMSTVFEKNGVQYNVSYEFTNEKAVFKFTNQDGMPVQKPKTILDAMVGPYVDIFEVVKKQTYAEGRRENEKMFLKLANLDAEKVYKFDADIKTNENNRLEVGREVTRLQGVVDSSTVDIDTYADPVEIKPLYDAFQADLASKSIPLSNAQREMDAKLKEKKDKSTLSEELIVLRDELTSIKSTIDKMTLNKGNIEHNTDKIEALLKEVAYLRDENERMEMDIVASQPVADKYDTVMKKGLAKVEEITSIDLFNKGIQEQAEATFKINSSLIEKANEELKQKLTQALETAVEAANVHNNFHVLAGQLLKDKEYLEANKNAYQDLTATIVSIRDNRRAYIMSGAFPIEGMEYTDEGIKYNNMLLDEGVMSTSDIIELGIKLANAYNPEGINFMPIPNASLFDQDHIERVQDFLQKNGLIGAFEMVDRKQEELTIEFLNEG